MPVTGKLGDLLNGNIAYRQSHEEIGYFNSTSNAEVEFVTVLRIYETAIAKGKGLYLEI